MPLPPAESQDPGPHGRAVISAEQTCQYTTHLASLLVEDAYNAAQRKRHATTIADRTCACDLLPHPEPHAGMPFCCREEQRFRCVGALQTSTVRRHLAVRAALCKGHVGPLTRALVQGLSLDLFCLNLVPISSVSSGT